MTKQVLLYLSLTLLVGCAFTGTNEEIPPDASPDATYISSFGEGCDEDVLCKTGLCVQTYRDTVLPEGLCTRECVWGGGCEEGYCVFKDEETGYCFPSCEYKDTPCRDGWTCVNIVGVNLCAPDEISPTQ